MKTIAIKQKSNRNRLMISAFLLALTLPAFSQGNGAEDRSYTVGILSAVLFALAVGVLMLISLIKQKNKDKKKLHRYLHTQRKHGKLTTYKY